MTVKEATTQEIFQHFRDYREKRDRRNEEVARIIARIPRITETINPLSNYCAACGWTGDDYVSGCPRCNRSFVG